jgi:hypothetical protein
MINKKNVPLYIALAVPAVMILVVAALVYIPQGFVHPKYSFVYASGGQYPYNYYIVKGQTLQVNPAVNNDQPAPPGQPQIKQPASQPPSLFIYDPVTNHSRPTTLEEVQKLKLDPTNKSPDGYEIANSRYDDGIFGIFGGPSQDYNAHYISGHGGSKKMDLKFISSQYYDPYSFYFLGWIVQ